MPTYDFLISIKAKEDLQRIWEYTLENLPENQADDYYFSMFNKIEQICDHPILPFSSRVSQQSSPFFLQSN